MGAGMGMDQVARDIAEIERLRKVLVPHARALFGFLRAEGGFTQRPSTRWMTEKGFSPPQAAGFSPVRVGVWGR
jgi:hypothetical protein